MNQPTPRRHVAKDNHKTVEIRLHLPHLNTIPLVRTVVRRVRRTSRKQRIIAAVLLIVAVGVITTYFQTRQAPSSAQAPTGTSNPLDQLKKGTPDYATLLPEGKTIEKLGGWTLVSPPEREPVYAYVDTVGSVPISVSQQPLPSSFKTDPDGKVKDLAMVQNSDKSIPIGSRKVYIGTSKNGPQSVIYSTDDLLILIKSSSTVPDQEWKAYIESLR